MSGAIVLDPTSTAAGQSRKACRRALGKRLGPFRVTTTSATPLTGVTADAPYQIVARILQSEGQPVGRLNNRFVYVTTGDSAGEQRRLVDDQHDDSEGLSLVDAPYDVPLPSGTEIEISLPLPSGEWGDYPTLNEIVGEALDRLPVLHDVGFTYVSQQVRYPLYNLPWQVLREQVLDVLPPIPSGYTAAQVRPRALNRGAWSFEYDGEQPVLVLNTSFNDGEQFFVKFGRPASSWVRHGGTWGDSTTGPTEDDDEILYDTATVAARGLPIAYERLSNYWLEQGDEKRAAMYADKLQDAAFGSLFARMFSIQRGSGAQQAGAVRRR